MMLGLCKVGCLLISSTSPFFKCRNTCRLAYQNQQAQYTLTLYHSAMSRCSRTVTRNSPEMYCYNPSGYFLITWDLCSTRSKKFSPKNQKDLGMASYSTPQKSKETRGNAITQPRSHPIKKNVEFRDGMGPRLGNGISPCFFAFLRGGI